MPTMRTRACSSLTSANSLRAIASAALLIVGIAARADEPPEAAAVEDSHGSLALALAHALRPQGFFTQLGVASEVTSGTAGLIWNPGWALSTPWSVYVEASLSRWQSRGGYPSDHGVLTQVALIPVFRYRLDEGRSRWFAEGGVGATATSSLYRHGERRFSTSFNFGDHVGVGYSFGQARRDEIALRFEHFSNAGIKHPNPGQNFVQLRYVHQFE